MSDRQDQGASLRDRATEASPRAGSRLGHSVGIPCADETSDELLIRRARETAAIANNGGTFGELMTPYAAIILVASAGRLEALLKELREVGEAIRELRLADAHAARTGFEGRWDRALTSVCQHENRIKLLLASAEQVAA